MATLSHNGSNGYLNSRSWNIFIWNLLFILLSPGLQLNTQKHIAMHAQNWHDIYMALFGILCISTFALPIHPHYMRHQFCNNRIGCHHFVYFAIIIYGLVPTAHWVSIHGGIGSYMVQRFVPNVLIVYSLMGVAFTFYALSFPERLKPGMIYI
jgi:hypothetical protein